MASKTLTEKIKAHLGEYPVQIVRVITEDSVTKILLATEEPILGQDMQNYLLDQITKIGGYGELVVDHEVTNGLVIDNKVAASYNKGVLGFAHTTFKGEEPAMIILYPTHAMAEYTSKVEEKLVDLPDRVLPG